MNLTSALRAKATIFLLIDDADNGFELRTHLGAAGYEVMLFRDEQTLLTRISPESPQVLIFSPTAITTEIAQFVDQVFEKSESLVFLPLVPSGQSPRYLPFQEYQFAPPIEWGEQLVARVLWGLDTLVATLLYKAHVRSVEGKAKLLQEELQNLHEQKAAATATTTEQMVFRVDDFHKHLMSLDTTEEMVAFAVSSLMLKEEKKGHQLRAITFRFLAPSETFVATQSFGIEIEKIRGVGARLEADESAQLIERLQAGQYPRGIMHLLKEGFQCEQPLVWPFVYDKTMDSLLVLWREKAEQPLQLHDVMQELFTLRGPYIERKCIQRLHLIDHRDPLTDLDTRGAYLKKLDEEISRARRLEQAVSVVKVSIDHFEELEQSFGLAARNLVVKTIAQILVKTSRVNDHTCRTDENEFALILPHCHHRGAAIRAERVRRLVENHTFHLAGTRLSVSCGISEYPSLCKSSEELEKTAQQALKFIQEKGGNKLCLYKAPVSFKPDFQVSVPKVNNVREDA